jgi:hypothetical protein
MLNDRPSPRGIEPPLSKDMPRVNCVKAKGYSLLVDTRAEIAPDQWLDPW